MDNVILIGMPGCGKSTVGKLLATRLGAEYVDSDEEVVRRAGKQIAEIFDTSGEAHFRKLEAEAIAALSSRSGLVIATGGGAPAQSGFINAIGSGDVVVFLDVSKETLLARLDGDTTRPMLAGANGREKLDELYRARKPIYQSVADFKITADGSQERVAEAIYKRLKSQKEKNNRAVTRRLRGTMAKKEMTQFAVIGLGSFGSSLVRTLHAMDADVLAMDRDKELVNEIAEYCTQAICADATDESVLKSIGLRNFDAVCVCIGDIEANIFVALLCKQMDVKCVLAKAQNKIHETVLDKIGADMVIIPEEYMGQKIANMLMHRTSLDIIELTPDFHIIDIKTPLKWQNKSLIQLEIRKKYNVAVLIVKRADNSVILTPAGDCILKPGDDLMICGATADIEKVKRISNVELESIDELL